MRQRYSVARATRYRRPPRSAPGALGSTRIRQQAAHRKESLMEAGSNGGTVVLVHGGFVDGSGWQPLYSLLRNDGYTVMVVQNPTLSLEDDVAATKRIVDAQSEPVVLVGHSYGGAVITEAGNDPNV